MATKKAIPKKAAVKKTPAAPKKTASGIQDKQDLAKLLYTQNRLTKKDTAFRAGVTEKTLAKWAEEGNWDHLRKSLLITKEDQLRYFYDQLDAFNKEIATRPKKYADSKEADAFKKLTAAIKDLETETNIADIVQVARLFINFLLIQDPAQAKTVTTLFDAFIKERLKKN